MTASGLSHIFCMKFSQQPSSLVMNAWVRPPRRGYQFHTVRSGAVSPDQRVDQLLSEGVHLHLNLRLRRYAEESPLICGHRYIELASFTAALRIQNSTHAKNLRQYFFRPSWTPNQRPLIQAWRHLVTLTPSPHTLPPRALHLKLVYSFRLLAPKCHFFAYLISGCQRFSARPRR